MLNSLSNFRHALCLVALLAFLIGSLAVPVSANDGKLQTLSGEIKDRSNRSLGMSLSVLKQIKHLNAEYRDDDGNAIIARKGEAQQKMGSVKLIVDALNVNYEAIDNLVEEFDAEAAKSDVDRAQATALRAGITASTTKMTKYRRAVAQFYDKAIATFGEPNEFTPVITAFDPDQRVMLTGEVSALLGSSSFKRPNTADPQIKGSTSDIGAGVNLKIAPGEGTNIDVKLSQRTTTQQRPIGLTNLGAAAVRQFSPEITATAGFDMLKYSDKDEDNFDYSDKTLFGKFLMNKPNMRVDAEIRKLSRGYSELAIADYSTTTFNSGVGMPAGNGDISIRLRYFKKSNEVDARDFSDFHPSLVYQLSPDGAKLGASYQKLSYPNVDDSPLDNNRVRLFYHMNSRDITSSKTYGPEFVMYKYPNAEESDYYDVKFFSNSQNRESGFKNTVWDVLYRLYPDSSQFDFVQLGWRRQTQPAGSGHYSKWQFAARVYTESSDQGDSLSLNVMHPPHSIDAYYSRGWRKTGVGTLRMMSFGPIFGARFLIDTEMDALVDGDLFDVDYKWRNPQNTARAGVEYGMRLWLSPSITITTDARFTYGMFYNADPRRSNTIIELKNRGSYPISPEMAVDGYLNLHRTRGSIESASDLDKFEIGFQFRYLFDVQRAMQ